VSQTGRYRELTPASLIGGTIVGLFLNVGIVFAGLQIGFTIVGSTVGAILGFGVLRGAMRKGSILEVNIFQTVASSVNTVNAGIIFTVPVLFLLGMQSQIDYGSLILASVAGSLLGVVLIIPLRKQIIEYERLRFPTAVGVAQILKSPGAGKEKAQLLFITLVASMAIVSLTYDWGFLAPVFPGTLDLGHVLRLPAGWSFTFAVSLLSLGAGYLAGRPGLVVLYGTLLNYWFLVPLCIGLGWVPEGYADFNFWDNSDAAYARAADFIGAFSLFTSRAVGIGMILGGAIAGLVIAGPAVKAAVSSLRSASLGERQEEISFNMITTGTVIGFVLLFLSAKLSGGADVSWLTALLVTLAGGLWLGLASLVVAQTTGRTDWSPLSGLALIAIAILMFIMGTADEFIVPAVTIGAAICVATSMCADMMADLKTGYLIGGMPLKQQIAQITTSWIGPGVSVAAVILLWNAFAFGPEQASVRYQMAADGGQQVLAEYEARGGTPDRLAEGVPVLGAPQAGALEGAIGIVQSGDVPLGKYLTGALLGLVVSVLVSPGIGVMVGLSMYLPFEYMIVFGIGGLTNIFVTRWKGARWAEDKGVPVAAGLIVGDALVGVLNALVTVAPQVTNVLRG
jgi:putative OPT family oligopeptide transporter